MAVLIYKSELCTIGVHSELAVDSLIYLPLSWAVLMDLAQRRWFWQQLWSQQQTKTGPTMSEGISNLMVQLCTDVMGHCRSYRIEYSCIFQESIFMGMPSPRNMAPRMKNMIIVLVRDGTGCHAFNICCLNCSSRGIYDDDLSYYICRGGLNYVPQYYNVNHLLNPIHHIKHIQYTNLHYLFNQ